MNVPSVLRYTLLRTALFAVVLAVLAALGVRGLLLLFLAVLISGLASYSLLSRQRDALSRTVDDRVRRLRTRLDEHTRAEDAADDLARNAPDSPARTAEPDPSSARKTDEASTTAAADEAVKEDLRGDQPARE